MTAFNIFKKKKPKRKRQNKIEKPKKIEEEKTEKRTVPEKKPKRAKEKKSDIAYHILKAPQITEKATNLAEKNQYVFKVWQKSNKPQIKKAVEDLYDVDVMSVKIINVRTEKKKIGQNIRMDSRI